MINPTPIHFNATSSVCHPSLPPLATPNLRRPYIRSNGTSLELLRPSACRSRGPFFHLRCSVSVERSFALIFQRAVRRVWLPSLRFQPPSIRGTLFQIPTLVGFALQSFPPLGESKKCFHLFSPFLHFPGKPHGPPNGAPTASSSPKSRVPSCPLTD